LVAGTGALLGGSVFGAIGTGVGAYLSDPASYKLNVWLMLGILASSALTAALILFVPRQAVRRIRRATLRPNTPR
jgi:hypothetical protein